MKFRKLVFYSTNMVEQNLLWKLGEKLVGFGHYDKLGENQGETKVKIKGTLETKSTLLKLVNTW